MIHVNAIELIEKFVIEHNVRPMKRWSLRNTNIQHPRYANYKKIIIQIRNLLELLSGGDIITMIKSFFYLYYNPLQTLY